MLTDAWGARDVAGVLARRRGAARAHAASRARGRSRASSGILDGHVARVRACQALEAQGSSAKDAAVTLKLHPFYVEKLFAQARNFTADELRDATVRLAELDHALKGGSRLPGELELERALIEITRRASARAQRRRWPRATCRPTSARPATSCARPAFRCSAPRATARSISCTSAAVLGCDRVRRRRPRRRRRGASSAS